MLDIFDFSSTITTTTLYALIVLGIGLSYLFYPAITTLKSQDTFRKVKPEVILETTTLIPILSLIIPAYDESERLPKMLQEAYDYLNKPNCKALKDLCACVGRKGTNSTLSVEWIVVNDGSKDNTSAVFREFVSKLPKDGRADMAWKLIPFQVNAGKGAAVQAGMLAATGSFCLMVDADGSTDFENGLEAFTERLVKHSKNVDALPILFGSRAHLRNDNIDSMGRSLIRSILTELFHICAVIFVGAADIKDTQCGFKLLPASAAHRIFDTIHLRRWAFDTELIYLANQLNYSVLEVSVPWHEVEGSKLHTSSMNLALVSIGMLRDMICVRMCYTLGLWKIQKRKE